MRGVAIVLLPFLTVFAGCLDGGSSPFDYRIKNQTDEPHGYSIIISAGTERGDLELFRTHVDVLPGQIYDGAADKAVCRASMTGRLWHTFEVDGSGSSTIGLRNLRCAASIFTGYHDGTRTGTTFE